MRQQVGNLAGQVHIEGIGSGSRTQQYPAFTLGAGHQRTAGQICLDRALFRQAVLDTSGQPQPVILARHQAEPGKRVEQRLYALFDKSFRVVDQQCAVRCRQHGDAPFQQLGAQRGQVGLQRPLDLLEQASRLPLFSQRARQFHGLLPIAVAHQHQHFAVERFLRALFGAYDQFVVIGAWHQLHQVGRQRRAVVPLPASERQYACQNQQEQSRQQPLSL
ncbi:hypothetical protein ALQ20_200182 [Pseudomonas syringae pv. atrofaciens]|nr:hypothetical protein ALQ20_200182 [Pseudomonas syringae pv. atrofaciens]